jgi:hypothetical protein
MVFGDDEKRNSVAHLPWNESNTEELHNRLIELASEGAYNFRPEFEGPNSTQMPHLYS